MIGARIWQLSVVLHGRQSVGGRFKPAGVGETIHLESLLAESCLEFSDGLRPKQPPELEMGGREDMVKLMREVM